MGWVISQVERVLRLSVSEGRRTKEGKVKRIVRLSASDGRVVIKDEAPTTQLEIDITGWLMCTF